MGLTEVFVRLAELAAATDAQPISKFDGCWEGVIGDGLQFAVNGHKQPRESTIAGTVPPFHAFFMRDGWPVAIVTPHGGRQLGEGSGTEDMIVDFLKEATVAAGGTPSDFHADFEEITP